MVFYTDSDYHTPLRTATDNTSVDTTPGSEDKPYIKAVSNGNTDITNCTATGFRLPGIAEWSCAARYKGSDSANGAYEYPASSGKWWTPGGYASGATADCNNTAATSLVAVYGTSSTAVVKSLGVNSCNALGLFDMSGNVLEWNFDVHPDEVEHLVVARGGSWAVSAFTQSVGTWISGISYAEGNSLGFRIARSAD